MSLKKNKTVVTPVSTGSMMESMTQRFESDMAELEAQRDSALNVFRVTANKLNSINEKLVANVNGYEAMITTLEAKKAAAQKAIADNTAVRSKIIDIIGE